MNIHSLPGGNWVQRMEMNLISALASQVAGTSQAAGTAASGSANAAADAATDATTTSSSTTGATPAVSAPVTPPAPQTNPFATDMMAVLLQAQSQQSMASQAATGLIGALDTNGDGSLSLSEVDQAMSKTGLTPASTDASTSPFAKAFGKMDTNGDGQLSGSELTAALQTLEQTAAAGMTAPHRHHHHRTDPGPTQQPSDPGPTQQASGAATGSPAATSSPSPGASAVADEAESSSAG